MKTEILYEDKQILVVKKPAGIPTQTAGTLQMDVVSELKLYLDKQIVEKRDKIIQKEIKNSPEKKKSGTKEPYLGIIHRLDQPVSGVLVFAKTPSSAAALTKQLTAHEMQKEYQAVVFFPKTEESRIISAATAHDIRQNNNRTSITLVDYLLKDGRTNTSRVVTEETPNAKRAELTYEVLKIIRHEGDLAAVLKIHLKTGRHHQIRVQLSHAGMPLLGDKKYGSGDSQELSRVLSVKDLALCAKKLTFYHPKTGRRLSFECEEDII